MSSFQLVILSSSPPSSSHDPQRRATRHATPPSEQQRVDDTAIDLETYGERADMERKTSGALRSGSKAAKAPDGATTGFATAGSLVRSSYFSIDLDDGFAAIESAKSFSNFDKVPETTSAATTKTDDAPKKTRKPRKPAAKKANKEKVHNADMAEVVEVVEKPKKVAPKPRKARAKKSETKPAEKPETVSKHFNGRTEIPDSEDEPEVDDVFKEQAVTRRQDWTPVKDTRMKENITPPAEPPKFTSIISGYAYEDMQPRAVITKITDAPPNEQTVKGLKKRRVELIEIPINNNNQNGSRSASPEKGKAPKKKPRTITDLVTGQYAAIDEQTLYHIHADTLPLKSAFFEPRPDAMNAFHDNPSTTTKKVPLNDVTEQTDAKQLKKPRRKRSTAKNPDKGDLTLKKASAKTSAQTSAKPKLVADKLLSPTSANLKLEQQDILFGTSSQLALEESPTVIRQIQEAIRESEYDADSEVLPGVAAQRAKQEEVRMAYVMKMGRLVEIEGTKKLWAASARDEDGEMLMKEDQLYMPEPDRTNDFALLMDGSKDDEPQTPKKDKESNPFKLWISPVKEILGSPMSPLSRSFWSRETEMSPEPSLHWGKNPSPEKKEKEGVVEKEEPVKKPRPVTPPRPRVTAYNNGGLASPTRQSTPGRRIRWASPIDDSEDDSAVNPSPPRSSPPGGSSAA